MKHIRISDMPRLQSLIQDYDGNDQEFIPRLLTVFEECDEIVAEHSFAVAGYARAMGRIMGLNDNESSVLYLAGLLHDLGKFMVPQNILYKLQTLTDTEWLQLKAHPYLGAQMLHANGRLIHLAPVVLSHHEFYNGRGYPHGIAGEEIPLIARIICVADVYEAMTSDRPYRKGYSHREAISRLRQGSGVHFDPEILQCFFQCIRKPIIG